MVQTWLLRVKKHSYATQEIFANRQMHVKKLKGPLKWINLEPIVFQLYCSINSLNNSYK